MLLTSKIENFIFSIISAATILLGWSLKPSCFRSFRLLEGKNGFSWIESDSERVALDHGLFRVREREKEGEREGERMRTKKR